MSEDSSPQARYSLFHGEGHTGRPAALLFHGMTSGPDEMRILAETLFRAGFDVLVPCLSGHSATIAELKTVRAEQWMDDAQRALLELRGRNPSSIVLAGVSFGSMLALYLATRSSSEIKALALLSPPLVLRSWRRQVGLRLLSYLPDSLLDRLGVVRKVHRLDTDFVRPRRSFDSHSIGALARAVYIRRMAAQRSRALTIPVLAVQDPHDHHLLAGATERLTALVGNSKFEQRWFPGGEHELPIGPRAEEVNACVTEFFLRAIGAG